MCDARNFYTVNMEVYLGTQPEGPYKVSNTPEEILLPIPLSSRLLSQHNMTMVGTLRKNKKINST